MPKKKWLAVREHIIKIIFHYIHEDHDIAQFYRKKGLVKEFIGFLLEKVSKYLNYRNELIYNLTEKQKDSVKKYIIAVFLLTRSPPFLRDQVSNISKLHPTTVNKIINVLGLEIPKYVNDRSQIFTTIYENAKFLIEIIDYNLKEKLYLAPQQAPTKAQLIQNGYKQFFYSIDHNEFFTYSDVLIEAGLFEFANPKFSDFFVEKFSLVLVNYINSLRPEKESSLYLFLNDETFNNIFNLSQIPRYKNYLSRTRKCFKLIVLALLKCKNYCELSESLQNLTKKTERTVRRYINEYIPFLSTVMDIDGSKWLPHAYHEYSFDEFREIIVSNGFELRFPSNKKEFERLKECTEGGVHRIYVTVHCGKSNHPEYRVRFDSILNGASCKYCTGYSITFNDIQELVELMGLKKTGRPGRLVFPSNENEYNALKNRLDFIPALFPLQVHCGNPNHPPWDSKYHYIQGGYWCTLCGDRYTAAGKYIHPILEYLTIKLLLSKNISCEDEFKPVLNKDFAVDIAIKRDRNFINSIEKRQSIIKNIKKNINLVSIDFTLSTIFKAIKPKFFKNYQGRNRILIIVLLIEEKNSKKIINEIYNEIQSLSDLSYKENIKVIIFSRYLDFLCLTPTILNISPLDKFEKSILNKFKKYFELTVEALNSVSELEIIKLSQISVKYKNKLDSIRGKKII